MRPPILKLIDTHLGFGGAPLLDGADLMLSAGERLCLVGRNGSGKSTFLKIAAGLIDADRCDHFLQPGTTVRYLPQEPDLSGYDSVLAYVQDGLAPGDEDYRAAYLLSHLGLTGAEVPATLSGGERRRAALARVLAPKPDILLLDEPTNHLDLPAIEWLESELRDLPSAMILISHDRRFLDNLSQAVIWLDRGTTRRLEKGFRHFEAWRDEVLENERVERRRLDQKIAAETHWLRRGVTARRKRNMGRLRALQDLREEKRAQRHIAGNVRMTTSEGEVSGKKVIDARGISKSFDGRTVVRDLTIRVQRGDRLGIVGPNGAGKTTLLKMLTGDLPPDTGRVKLGTTLQMAAVDQGRELLKSGISLQAALTGGGSDMVSVDGEKKHVISYMKDFLFTPDQAGTPVAALSGGERGRLMLARSLAEPSNLLILDEPTNDLDLETLDLLQEVLADYPGTVLLVSHDRDFLDRVVTSVLHAESDGRWLEYAGGYSDMLAQRRRGAEPAGKPNPGNSRRAKGGNGGGEKKPASAKRPAKLSFKDKHALETLPATIADLEENIAALQKKLGDPDFYARDPDGFAKAGEALEQAGTRLAEAEEEWLRLEILRDELEGA